MYAGEAPDVERQDVNKSLTTKCAEDETVERRDSDKASTADRAEVDIPALKSWPRRLALWSGIYTKESFFKIFIRPFGLILLPAVLWATLVL